MEDSMNKETQSTSTEKDTEKTSQTADASSENETKVSMNQDAKLTIEERKMLKRELMESWPELPKELQEYIIEAKRQKLKVLYMLQDWARNNGHETMLDLLTRKITHKEDKLKKMEQGM